MQYKTGFFKTVDHKLYEANQDTGYCNESLFAGNSIHDDIPATDNAEQKYENVPPNYPHAYPMLSASDNNALVDIMPGAVQRSDMNGCTKTEHNVRGTVDVAVGGDMTTLTQN